MILKRLNKTVTTFALVLCSTTTYAEATIEDAINKLAQAYGGEKLTSLKAITIHDYRKSLWPGQNESANLPDFWRINEELTIDFDDKNKSLLSWRVDRTNKDLEQYIATESSGRVYDILHKRYSDDDWYNYNNTGSSIERSSDTLIAKKLLQANKDITLIGETTYRGNPHYQLSYILSGNTKSTIYIDKTSGLIQKVSRQHPRSGELNYIFSNHSQVAGIAFSRDMNFYVAGTPRNISTYRNIDVAPDIAKKMAPPKQYQSWGKPLENADMSYNELAKHIYHVGSGRSRALFVETEDGFISVGGDRKLADNFTSLQKYLNSHKPLKMAVLTHHHSEHLNMVEPALKLGAKVLTVKNKMSLISEKLGKEVDMDNFVFVDKTLRLRNQDMVIHDIPSAHTDSNLVAYLPKAKILFAEDHYESLYQQSSLRVFNNMVKFDRNLASLNLDIEYLVDGASPRILTMKEFNKAVAGFAEPKCPQGFTVCQNG